MDERKYREYRELARTITGGDERYLDLLHDVLIDLSGSDKWNNIPTKKERMYYLTRTLSNQFYSNNSKFNRTYRKFNTEVFENIELEDEPYMEKPTMDWVNEILEKEMKDHPDKWYDIGLFQLYMKTRKIDLIHKKTRIPKYSIRETIKQMKFWIKQKWKEEWEK
jgi:hypothetical protein